MLIPLDYIYALSTNYLYCWVYLGIPRIRFCNTSFTSVYKKKGMTRLVSLSYLKSYPFGLFLAHGICNCCFQLITKSVSGKYSAVGTD